MSGRAERQEEWYREANLRLFPAGKADEGFFLYIQMHGGGMFALRVGTLAGDLGLRITILKAP